MPVNHTRDDSAPDSAPDAVVDPALARAAADLRAAVDDMRVGARRRVPARHRRRVRWAVATGLATVTLLGAAGVIYLRSQAGELRQIHVDGLATIDTTAATAEPPIVSTVGEPVLTVPVTSGPVPPTTAPPVLTQPVNVLVVGVDTRADGSVPGTRSDTIAVVRLDPANGRVSVLSIPRDLWVERADNGRHGRINALLGADGDPSTLVATIAATFGIDIHHYVAIDFAGFQDLIDLAGGIDVPFESAVRDVHTGFAADAGCRHLDGTEALAYVRARYLEQFDPRTGTWKRDPVSDLGRIARQQDLVRRLYTTVLAADYGLGDQLEILTDVVDDITVDDGLDLGALRKMFNTARSIGSANFATYSLSGVVTPSTISGNAVLVAGEGLDDVVEQFLHGTNDAPSSPVPTGAIVPAAAETCP